MKDPQCVSNLRNNKKRSHTQLDSRKQVIAFQDRVRKFMDNYDWSGLEFPVSIKDIGKFETRNNISVNVLAVEGRDIYIHRKGQRVG